LGHNSITNKWNVESNPPKYLQNYWKNGPTKQIVGFSIRIFRPLNSRCLFIIKIFRSKKIHESNLNHQNVEIPTWLNSSHENPIKQKKLGSNFRHFLLDWPKTKICELEFVVKRTIKHHFFDSFSQHYFLPLFSSLLGFSIKFCFTSILSLFYCIVLLVLFYLILWFFVSTNFGFSIKQILLFFSNFIQKSFQELLIFHFLFIFQHSTLILRHE
jgi:hypothetical protein